MSATGVWQRLVQSLSVISGRPVTVSPPPPPRLFPPCYSSLLPPPPLVTPFVQSLCCFPSFQPPSQVLSYSPSTFAVILPLPVCLANLPSIIPVLSPLSLDFAPARPPSVSFPPSQPICSPHFLSQLFTYSSPPTHLSYSFTSPTFQYRFFLSCFYFLSSHLPFTALGPSLCFYSPCFSPHFCGHNPSHTNLIINLLPSLKLHFRRRALPSSCKSLNLPIHAFRCHSSYRILPLLLFVSMPLFYSFIFRFCVSLSQFRKYIPKHNNLFPCLPSKSN